MDPTSFGMTEGACPVPTRSDFDMSKVLNKAFHAYLIHQQDSQYDMKCLEQRLVPYPEGSDPNHFY